MSAVPVLFQIEGAVATITLNRPEVGNSVDIALARALLDAAVRCDEDVALRCVVLTGAGKLFCGGGDLSAFGDAADIPTLLEELATTLHQAILRLLRMRKPLLVLVNGPAAGAGLSLSLLGDVVVASETAHFMAAYGSVGLSPDGGMSWLLPRLVGMRRAQEIIISNRRVSAQEAAAMGLITRAVPDENLPEEGRRQALVLAVAPTFGVAQARSLLLESFNSPLEVQLDREVCAIVAAGATQDCREGVSAFVARRSPRFSGV